jgi:hypothetical protein
MSRGTDDIEEIIITPDDYDWSTFDLAHFKAWISLEAPSGQTPYIDLWVKAVEHRNAWKAGVAKAWESPYDLVRAHDDIWGPFAWIGPKGETYPASFASHDIVCDIIIGADVSEVEKTHCRVSQLAHTVEETWKYVTQPTLRQKRVTRKFMEHNWMWLPKCKDIR